MYQATNGPITPDTHSTPARRGFLRNLAALPLIGGAAGTLVSPALANTPDPIFALIEAEQAARDAWDIALDAHGEADKAVLASEWHRRPRVQVGEYTSFVRGPDFEPIPLHEQAPQPVYVHDHAAIDRDCDAFARWDAESSEQVEERRARLHRELDADAEAIASAPVIVRRAEAEARSDAAGDVASAAYEAALTATPTTPAGLLAQIDLFIKRDVREMGQIPEPVDELLLGIFRSVRAVVGASV